jgi:DNA ligase D-like protein (predicted ligase)
MKWVTPMLATLTDKPFTRRGWIFERKLDGIRVLGMRDRDDVRLMSRNKLVLNRAYPELVDALQAQRSRDFIVDGEVVAFEGRRTSFARLQQRMGLHDPDRARRTGVRVYYYLFDLLRLNGSSTTALPLVKRKEMLKDAITFGGPLRYTSHRTTYGERYLEEACRNGWEGLIAKRADGAYLRGRSTDWLKLKCVNEQELVIGGWTDPKGSRVGLGALLVGYYEAGALRYAGDVGTGFSTQMLRDLAAKLAKLERPTPPFTRDGLPRKGVHWAAPKLVAQVGFTEWTRDGKLRHPRFLGLRHDKSPRDVVRERPKR